MTSSYSIAHHTNGTLQAAIAEPAVPLYVPLHAVICGGADGPARPAFDKPGDPFASFTNPAITEDQEIAAPLSRLGAEAPGRLLRPWP